MKNFNFGAFIQRLDPGTYSITRSLFLRLLGFVYFCAFVSLWTQIDGLIGTNGVLPVESFLKQVEARIPGMERFHLAPTLCWISGGNGFLTFQCLLGTILSISLMAGFFPTAALAGMWVLWLSLSVAGQTFLQFQWDVLLLETGLLAIFFAPLKMRLNSAEPPSTRVLWLFRWLLFRLMFLSGIVKLLSGDPAWRNFTALFYHFETQPLPTTIGWFAFQLPTWVQVAQTGVMFVIELVVPFFIFLPRKFRIAAFFPLVALQVGIALTGNYCYFNLLTIIICVLLLDDQALARIFRFAQRSQIDVTNPLPLPRWSILVARVRRGAIALLTAVILIVTAVQMISILAAKDNWGTSVVYLRRAVQPFRSINTYGLFAFMTKTRPEIIIEGSMDGQNWRPYEFKYKPGDLKKRPRFVAPHQPRLDWQMWFAALGTYNENPWFTEFCLRLIQGTPEVLALLETNPFPDQPPKYLRALTYQYEFTSSTVREETGQWWQRGESKIYLPMVGTKP